MSGAFDLSGRVALVTGANTGIGQGIAVALAQAGADIVGVSRSDSGETQAHVTAAGRGFLPVAADLSSTAPIGWRASDMMPALLASRMNFIHNSVSI